MSHALTIISFFELPEEEQPPQEMWLDDEAISEWFIAVKQRREDRAKGIETIEDEVPEMWVNEHAKGLRG